MLYTVAQNPQVLVTVDGLPAVCPAANCDYSYIEDQNQGKIVWASLEGRQITVEVQNLDEQGCTNSAASSLTVGLGDSECVGTQEFVSSGEITCELDHLPEAGDHYARVTGACGAYEYSSSNIISVPLTITDTVPSSGLSVEGNEKIIVRGTGFPANLRPTVNLGEG
jgi:hypothetical protein